MARLRIRMELNRGRAGVPLQELARVVGEAQKFFAMLADDVHIDRAAGEWQASNFDNEFLNFTAEFTGPVEVHQIEQFRAAFDGVTLLRRATIAQFARIASALGEDETIAFGLYLNDEDVEPGEWRSLSKRDAMRIDSEIRELLAQSGESDAELATPAALDTAAVTNLFAGSRERGVLTERIARLETEIARHEEEFEKMRAAAARTDQGLERLVEAVDAFCERATRHMELLPPPAPRKSNNVGRRISVILVLLCAAAGSWLWLFRGNTDPRPADGRVRAADPARVTPPPPEPTRTPLPTELPPPPPSSSRIIVLKALEPNWITVYVDSEVILSKLLNPGESTTLDQPGTFRARLGNAGGVEILVDGKPIGPIGHKGQVVTVEFTGTTFHIVPSGKLPS